MTILPVQMESFLHITCEEISICMTDIIQGNALHLPIGMFPFLTVFPVKCPYNLLFEILSYHGF